MIFPCRIGGDECVAIDGRQRFCVLAASWGDDPAELVKVQGALGIVGADFEVCGTWHKSALLWVIKVMGKLVSVCCEIKYLYCTYVQLSSSRRSFVAGPEEDAGT